ncbi:MAG: ABC transporter permease [Clostridium sp.]|uniref:ABC transporter permease n=1 Tax=Clostridium sp. TaxID=1506 RepID=UPI003D6D92C1
MKSFWSLIPRNLIKNKKRVFFMAVGIILSISLIISLSIMLDTLKSSSYKRMVDDFGGTYDGFFYAPDKKDLEKLDKDPVVDKTSSVLKLGDYKVPNSKYILEVNGFDKNITEFINFKIIQGRYPESNSEIAMEDWVLNAMPKKYKIGDKIKLNLTIGRFEKFKKEEEFTLTGIFQYKFNTNQLKNTGLAYIPKDYAEVVLPPKERLYRGYLNINPKLPMEESFMLLPATDDYKNIEFNKNSSKSFLLQAYKSIDFVSIILYIVISIVASVIIYNIFNMSVIERIREFGMLRAIGASPSKIKMLVLGEGLILGFIFIPLGIIIGNFVVKGIIILMSGYKDFSRIMHIPKSGIIVSFIVGFLTIIIGVYSPAKKASEISPMEAINSNNNLQLKGKNIKENSRMKKIINKNFGFTADMAYLNLNRNKKRFITTVVSLSISIIMFMLVNYLINAADPINSIKAKMGGDFVISVAEDQPNYYLSDSELDDIKDIKGIDKIVKLKTSTSLMQVEKELVTSNGVKFLAKASKSSQESIYDFEKQRYKFKTEIRGYTLEDLDNIKENIIQGKMDKEKMLKEPMIILGQNLNYSNYTKLKVGDKIQLSYCAYDEDGRFKDYKSEIFTIGALLKEDFNTYDAQSNNVIIVSDKVAEKYLNIKGYQNVKVTLSKNANYDEVEKTLKQRLIKHRGAGLVSYKEALEKAKKNSLQVSLIMYSFVIVVAIVSMVNLLNIMSMNILLRKKEIGMLRAIGFGNDEVKKMIRAEGMFYGVASGFLGTALGTVLSFILFVLARKSLTQGMTWSLPIFTIIVLFLATIAVCLFSSMNASRKVFSSSIIESIKGEE